MKKDEQLYFAGFLDGVNYQKAQAAEPVTVPARAKAKKAPASRPKFAKWQTPKAVKNKPLLDGIHRGVSRVAFQIHNSVSLEDPANDKSTLSECYHQTWKHVWEQFAAHPKGFDIAQYATVKGMGQSILSCLSQHRRSRHYLGVLSDIVATL